MTTIVQLTEVGEKLGLKGEHLLDIIREQQAQERDERSRDRAMREINREKEMERGRLEREKVEKEKMELSLKKMAIEAKTQGYDMDLFSSKGIKGPKMPPFDELKDNMDSFLNRFERYAETQKWQKDEWATFLSALLRGKALDVYSRLPAEEAKEFERLKDALLRRFQMTEDGFRDKFRTSKSEQGKAPRQFINRLDNYLVRWIELAKVEKTFEGLKDLFVKEQYLSVCPTDLALFLRERAPENLENLSVLTQQYPVSYTHLTLPTIYSV